MAAYGEYGQDYAAHWWVFEGVADFVRLKAGLGPAHWVALGSWDKGYDVTARFLDYSDSLIKAGFVAELNAMMKDNGYSDEYFVQILGKNVDELWYTHVDELLVQVHHIAQG